MAMSCICLSNKTMLCYVMLCFVMLLCYVMLCYVMLCYVMFGYVMLCYQRKDPMWHWLLHNRIIWSGTFLSDFAYHQVLLWAIYILQFQITTQFDL